MMTASQRGDTIVEVLIAIAVVSMVLGGAYAAAQNSLATTQRTQERSEASQLVQRQLEILKESSQDPTLRTAIFSATEAFCLKTTGSGVAMHQAPDCNFGDEDRYEILTTRGSGSDQNTFTSVATWQRLAGGQPERVEFVYRIYEP